MTRWPAPLALLLFAMPAPALAQSDDLGGWSGFYVGVDLGLSGGKLHASGTDTVVQVSNINPPGPQPLTVVPGTSFGYAGSDRKTDVLYGATAGFLARSGNWLFGLEGDGHGPRDAGSFAISAPLPATALAPAGTVSAARDARISWDWAARARVGYTWGPAMVYAAGGIASARVRLRGEDVFATPAGNAAASPGNPPFAAPAFGPIAIAVAERGTLTGWTAGIGGEHRLGRHFGIGLDARYTDYGSRTYAMNPGCNTASLAYSPNGIAQGTCPGATIAGAGTVTYPAGTTPASTSPLTTEIYPGALPGPTRISLSEWRLSARLIFRF
jgi:outer membrane immunogenic protein